MRSSGMNTTVLVSGRRAVAGAEELSDFCGREYPRLVGTLTLYCGDAEVAAELAQEALARACASWTRVSRMDAPGPWVNRVAINLANSYFRRRSAERRARERLESRREAGAESPEPDTTVAVRRAVAALPTRQKTALVLRYFSDLPVAQVADLMGASEGAVRRLTHKAIASLRERHGLDGLEASHDS